MLKKLFSSWQDAVFGIGAFGLSLTMLPGLLNPATFMPIVTSIIIATIVTAFAVTQASMKMWFGMTMNALNALSWVAMAIFRS